MNELLFLIHIILIVALSLLSLRAGKEALILVSSFFCLIANAFIMKQTTLFGLSVTCTDAYSVGSLLALNLTQQYFGKEAAKKAMNLSFATLICFSLFSMIHLLYAPLTDDAPFIFILKSSPRITAASLVTFFIVQRFDLFLFGKLKMAALPLSLLISQTLDTLLFSILGLYGLVPSLFDIFMMSLAVKCIAIACMSPLATSILKKGTTHD